MKRNKSKFDLQVTQRDDSSLTSKMLKGKNSRSTTIKSLKGPQSKFDHQIIEGTKVRVRVLTLF